MDLVWQFGILGFLLPLGIAAVLSLGLLKILPQDLGDRYGAAVAVAAAFVIAYGLATNFENWVPARHWHWVPYLAAAAGVIGPLVFASGAWRPERWLILLLFAAVGAWLIVPHWRTLEPMRPTIVVLLTIYLAVLSMGLGELGRRIEGWQLGLLFGTAAAVMGVMILVGFYQLFGQLSISVGASFFGVALASLLHRRSTLNLPGAAIVYACAAGSIAFAGCVEPEPPLYEFLLAAASPLALWGTLMPRLSRLSPRRLFIVRVSFLMLPLIAAAAWLGIRIAWASE